MPTAAKVERINISSASLSSATVSAPVSVISGDLDNNNNNKMTTKNSTSNQSAQDATKIANTIIEKKIRNLEKRKARLLEIKALEDEGKQLEPDQITAVKKLDSVVEMVDMLKEINKNVSDSLNEYAKQQKKQQKKEQQDKMIERNQLELERIKLLLRIQTILPRISSIKKSLSLNDNISLEIETKHIEALEQLAKFSNNNIEDLDNYAEKVHLILDGSKKEFSNGMSHLEVKEFFIKMIETRYLENIKEPNDFSNNKDEIVAKSNDTKESQSKVIVVNEKPQITKEINKPGPNKISEHVESDLQKDPAVIASGFAYPSFSNANCPINFLTTNNTVMEYPMIYSTVTQTFTNPNYGTMISNKVPLFEPTVSISNQVISENLIRSVDQVQNQDMSSKTELLNGSTSVVEQGKKTNDDLATSQDDTKNHDVSNMNGHGYNNTATINTATNKRNNYRGNSSRGNSRNFSNSFRGRGNGKNFGYFNNGQQGNTNFTSGNYNGNHRLVNRQNGGNGRGLYRSKERNNTRNHFNQNQVVPTSNAY